VSSQRSIPQPPHPPEGERRVKWRIQQLIGIPIIALIPMLALAGVFTLALDHASASNAQLEMRVQYPSRSRYKMAQTLNVRLRNISTETLPGVQVSFDRSYIESFTNTTFTPNVNTIDAEAYVVDLGELAPDATREVTVQLSPEKRGQLQGTVSASVPGVEPIVVEVKGFVFP
jgi:hypothetical protein